MVSGRGSISVLVSTELKTLLSALRGFDGELRKQIRSATKKAAEPIWQEEVRGRVATRMQSVVLGDTARVSVSDSNVLLKSATLGKTASGTPASTLWAGAELGSVDKTNKQPYRGRSRRGKSYTVPAGGRHTGRQFGPYRRQGKVVFPAARESIPRLASLWVQTTVRTLHEAFEKGGAK